MKYMLMMQATKADFDSYKAWPPQDLKANIDFMRRFSKELTESGEFVSRGVGLAGAGQGGAGPEGRPPRGDGRPVPGGQGVPRRLLDPERAIEIAARASAAPGPGGAPGSIPIEVRQVMRSAEDLF